MPLCVQRSGLGAFPADCHSDPDCWVVKEFFECVAVDAAQSGLRASRVPAEAQSSAPRLRLSFHSSSGSMGIVVGAVGPSNPGPT